MRFRSFALSLLIVSISFADRTAAAAPPVVPPKFDAFSTAVLVIRSPGHADFSTNPAAARFRSAILSAVSEGVNFAGSYTLAEWGCGTGCVGIAVLRARDGAIVFYAPELGAGPPLGNGEAGTPYGIEYRKDSSLLVINPPEPGETDNASWLCDRLQSAWGDTALPRYFAWQDERLKEVTPPAMREREFSCAEAYPEGDPEQE